jgi:quercetin dioxygenase-like cupin family protein
MKNAKYLLSAAVASTVLAGMLSFQAIASEEYVPKVNAKTLYKAPLQGVEGKEVVVKHFGIPPKFVGGKHVHPGPVFVYVLEGEFTVETADGTKTFRAGELYPESINEAMVGRNLSGTDDLELLVFQVGEIGKPMMIKVK